MGRPPVEICLGNHAEPGTEIATLREHVAAPDRGHRGARDDRADTRHGHQPFAALVLAGQRLDFGRDLVDALIEAAPIGGQGLDDADHARRQPAGVGSKDVRQRAAQTLDALRHRDAAIQ